MLEVGGYTAPFLTVGNLIEHGGHLTLITHLFFNNLVDEVSINRSGESLLNIAARKGDVVPAVLEARVMSLPMLTLSTSDQATSSGIWF